jgi:protein-S-isoprenylcysteine O-methyltransferase Ste14
MREAATAAAALYGLGLVVLFGLRSWQQKRAIGRFGFNGFIATRQPVARLGGLLFAAAVLAGLAAPTLAALGRLPVLTPAGRSATLLLSGVGLLIALVGFALAVVAQQTMGQSWRIGVDPTERTDLITHGVFAWVRNPIFTAMIIAQAGTVVMAPTWLALAGLVLLIAAIEL